MAPICAEGCGDYSNYMRKVRGFESSEMIWPFLAVYVIMIFLYGIISVVAYI